MCGRYDLSCQWIRFPTDLTDPTYHEKATITLCHAIRIFLKHSMSLCDTVPCHKYLSIFRIKPLRAYSGE